MPPEVKLEASPPFPVRKFRELHQTNDFSSHF